MAKHDAKKKDSALSLPNNDFSKRVSNNMMFGQEKLKRHRAMIDKYHCIGLEDAARTFLEYGGSLVVKTLQGHILERSSRGYEQTGQTLTVLVRNVVYEDDTTEAVVELCEQFEKEKDALFKITKGPKMFLRDCSEDACKMYYAIRELTWSESNREFFRKELQKNLGVSVESISDQVIVETNKFCSFGFEWHHLA